MQKYGLYNPVTCVLCMYSIYLESRHVCIVHVFTSSQLKVMSSLVNGFRYVSTANLLGFLRKNTTGT